MRPEVAREAGKRLGKSQTDLDAAVLLMGRKWRRSHAREHGALGRPVGGLARVDEDVDRVPTEGCKRC